MVDDETWRSVFGRHACEFEVSTNVFRTQLGPAFTIRFRSDDLVGDMFSSPDGSDFCRRYVVRLQRVPGTEAPAPWTTPREPWIGGPPDGRFFDDDPRFAPEPPKQCGHPVWPGGPNAKCVP